MRFNKLFLQQNNDGKRTVHRKQTRGNHHIDYTQFRIKINTI